MSAHRPLEATNTKAKGATDHHKTSKSGKKQKQVGVDVTMIIMIRPNDNDNSNISQSLT